MIPVFEPEIGDEEIKAVETALRRGELSGSFGESIPLFEVRFADYCGRRFGVAVNSGTSALHLAVTAADIGPGDEVIVSACTNVATALAVYHNGAVPIPVDSEPVTWNLNLDLIESLITPATRAIIPVHVYGHPVDMERLCNLADRHDLIVIEDCAEAHGAKCRGRMIGSFGQMSCFSFYGNKVITTGEGGMILTDDEALDAKLRLLRNVGFTTPRFRHDVAGFNFRMTGYQAAMGVVQTERIEEIIARKRRIAQTYSECLAVVAGLNLPTEASWARHVYWMYALTVEPEFGASRDELAAHLRSQGIGTRTFFCPMNQQPFLRRQSGFRDVPCPVADCLWEKGLYLPSSLSLDTETIKTIADAIGGVRVA